MALTQEEVQKIAKLAHLRLTNQEISLYQSQLVRILESMNELSKLDTTAVSPMTSSLLGVSNVWREDTSKLFPEIEKLLKNAPEHDGPYFKVPKVIE